MSEWTSVSLRDATVSHDSRRVPVKKSDRVEGPYAYYGASGVIDYVNDFIFDGTYLLVAEDGDNLRTRNTPIAFLGHGRFWVNNHAHVLEAAPGFDIRFLHYAMQLVDVAGYLTGSTRPKLTAKSIGRIEVQAPHLDEQRRIASVLGAFDDLIETNRAQASRAARLARATGETFMSTLTGRDSSPLSNFCQVVKGFSYKSAELVEGADTLVNLKNIGRTGTFERRGFKPLMSDRFKPGQVVGPGDVVVSMTDLTQDRNVIARPVRVPDATVEGHMVASLDLAVLRPINGFSAEFLLAALARDEFRDFALGFCNGTTVLHLGAQVFDKYRLPAVSSEETSELVTNMSTLHALEDSCLAEAEELARTRGDLLPLLMSGKVRVEDVEIPKGAA